ncbi:MAG: cytochrome-c peroxidase, partial [Deltaproteobacteria bacterium]
GSPELTAGIPGGGPLTVDEIKAWLDKPENHEVLTVLLPTGLDAGRIPQEILQSNPFTRAKIELGRQLYFDARLSADGTVSCASCHDPDEGYARHTRFGVGINKQEGNRNSPVSYNRILSFNQFWDGRAASLEEQAVGPIANPIEMGNTHEQAVESVKGIEGYRLQFARVFGNEGVTIGNVGKAIAAFERMLVTGPSPADFYEKLAPMLRLTKDDFEDDPELEKLFEARKADVEAHPMSESAIRGRELFFSQRVNCARCHVGANFSDEKYHNLGIGMDQPDPDLGRYKVTKVDADRGAFKTPTIRNIALSAPYMHDGSLKTLAEVVEHYDKGGIPNKYLSTNIPKLNLKDQEKLDLVAFMEACTGDFPKVERGRLPE